MRSYVALVGPRGRSPVLIGEGFSVGAFVFGGLWLLAHRAWVAGLLALCAAFAIGMLAPPPVRTVLELALAACLGLTGQDLRIWSLERRGWRLVHVVRERGEERALARLLDHEPALIAPETGR